MKLFIVSGRSGAGKSVVLKVLEDIGFYCVDNIPLELLPNLIDLKKPEHQLLAVSVDIRNLPKQANVFLKYFSDLKKEASNEIISVFLDAEDDILIKRFEETKRLHPLSKIRKEGVEPLTLEEAIKKEHAILDIVAENTDVMIDTSNLTVYDLADKVSSLVLGKKTKEITYVFQSFGFKHGIVKDADFVFDARFLPNPHWIPSLRTLTGLDKEVQKFFANYPEVQLYTQQIEMLINSWIPYLERNNRSYVTIAVGCTGGQHRSVFIAHTLANRFIKKGKNVVEKHKMIKAKVVTQ